LLFASGNLHHEKHEDDGDEKLIRSP